MKKDYGTKFECYNCGAKFYDMGKPQAICPLCDADQAKRPKKAAKKAFRAVEIEDKIMEEEEKIEVGEGEETLLIDIDEPEFQEGLGEDTLLMTEEEDVEE